MQIPVEGEGQQSRQEHRQRGLEKKPPTHTHRTRGEPRHPGLGNQKGFLESVSLVLIPSVLDRPQP